MVRMLVFTAVFFIGGILAFAFEADVFVLSFFALAITLYAFFFRKKLLGLVVAATLIGVAGGARMYIAQINADRIVDKYDGKTVNTYVTATDFSDNLAFIGEIKIDGEKLKVNMRSKTPLNLSPGDRIKCSISLYKPYENNNIKQNYASYLKGKNIFLSGYTEVQNPKKEKCEGIRQVIFSIRKSICNVSQNSFDGEVHALFNAIIVGDKRFMTERLSNILQSAGLNHIAVVSGMHLSVMLTAIMFLINKLFGKRRIGNIVAIFVVIIITMVTGMGSSILRACIMCCIYQLARLCYRECDFLTSLSASALCMTAFNPFIIYDAGFVLSVLSVLGIILYSQKITMALEKFLPPILSSSAAVCIAANLTVIPAVMYYFGIFTPYALIANLLVFMFSSWTVVLGLFFAPLSVVPIVYVVVKAVIEFSCLAVIAVCELIALLPYAVIKVNGCDAELLIVWITLLVALFLFPKGKRIVTMLGIVATALIAVCIAVEISLGDSMHIQFLRYGANECSIVELPSTEKIIIDCYDAADAMHFCEKYSGGKFTYAIQSSEKSDEMQSLILSGAVENYIVCRDASNEEELSKIKNTNIIVLERGEEFHISSKATVSYPLLGGEHNGSDGVSIEYDGRKFLTLQAMDEGDMRSLFQNGVRINCSAIKLPYMFDKEKILNSKMICGEVIDGKKEVFIK